MNPHELLEDPEFRREFEAELLVGKVADAIERAIDESGLSKLQVAAALGVTPGRVSQLVSGENLTLRTVAETASTLGFRVEISFSNLQMGQLARDGSEDRYRWNSPEIPSAPDADPHLVLAA